MVLFCVPRPPPSWLGLAFRTPRVSGKCHVALWSRSLRQTARSAPSWLSPCGSALVVALDGETAAGARRGHVGLPEMHGRVSA